jgi:transglutaminase-like putative cysteine protease
MTNINSTSKTHRILSILVTLGLLLQTLAPTLTLRPQTAVAANTAASLSQVDLNNVGTADAITTQPALLSQPLSVARTQSSFVDLGSQVIITYTIQNTLSPQLLPDVPEDATPEELVDALANFDPTADPHTLRNVILVATVTDDSDIIATSQPADVDGDDFVFQLEHLPPQASATIVVTATTPAAVSAATPLVNAAGWASLNGGAVTAVAAPALALPPAFGDWLLSTMDANTGDIEMLQAVAQTGGDAAAIFAFARALEYEAYRGSLRGTRGTLWSSAGNSLDQSNLLIAMLRASGIPARYRHGTLSTANAQTLIASMFPAPTAILGQVAADLPISDPVNDANLIAEVQDHWWVEAHLDGAWTDLDPSFANAAIGQQFATPTSAGTDRIAEVPDSFRPKITFDLDVEMYNVFNANWLGQSETTLSHTFRTVEIATSSVVLAHQVTSEGQGGLVYANTIHTYNPFLYIEDSDEIIFGESYQELITNFPVATTFITGAWLRFALEDIDGNVTHFERTLKDRLSYEVRTYGGAPAIAVGNASPSIFSELDLYSIAIFPNLVPTAAFETRRAALTQVNVALAADTAEMQQLADLEPLTAAQETEAAQIRARYQRNLGLLLNGVNLSFAEAAGRASQVAQDALFVKAYHDAPRLIILSHEVVDDAAQMNVDLRTTLERTMAHPGQGEPATFGFNLFKGINESWLEGQVLSSMTDKDVLTTAQVMQAASEQEIEFLFIGETNLDLLPTVGLGAEAEARITTAVLNGKVINVPATAPLINGEPAIGWWEIDLETGETIGVMENGLHNALVEYIGALMFGSTVGRLADFMIGATAATFDFMGQQLFKATGEGDFGTPAKKAMSKMNQGLGCLLGDAAGCSGKGKGYIDYGYMVMEAALNYLNENDPPLPDLLIGNTIVTLTQSSATTILSLPANLSGGTITADLQTDFTQLTAADGGLSFYAAALDPLVSGASGGQTAVNHTNSANLTLTNADLQIAALTGSLTSDGQPVALGDGLALANFDGSLAINATAPDTDGVLLDGSGDLFTLTTTPGSSTIAPVDSVQFDVDIATTFSDAFTVTVAAPGRLAGGDGWRGSGNGRSPLRRRRR